MADCFWTDLVGVEQDCSASTGPSGYELRNIGNNVDSFGYLAGPGVGVWSSYASIMSDASGGDVREEIDSFSDRSALGTDGETVVALGRMSSSAPFVLDAVTTVDGVTTTRYTEVLSFPDSVQAYAVAYHAARGKFYALITVGTGMGLESRVYEMGATPATWTLSHTIDSTEPGLRMVYLPGTEELVVVETLENAYVFHVLGASGGFSTHTPTGGLPPAWYSAPISYCAGTGKYVLRVTNDDPETESSAHLYAASALNGEFLDTGFSTSYGYGGWVISPPGKDFVVWGDGYLCGTKIGRIYSSDDLVTATVLFDSSTDPDPGSAHPGDPVGQGVLCSVFAFVPGSETGTGVIYADVDNYCF